MRDDLLLQFGASELPRYVTALLEHAHAVARGTEAAIRVARVCSVQAELGERAGIAQTDLDGLLALAQSSSALLGDRLESVGQHDYDESRRLLGNKQSSRGAV